MTLKRAVHAMVFSLGLVLMLPAVRSVTSNLSASGYNIITGINGEDICNPGGTDDCPG